MRLRFNVSALVTGFLVAGGLLSCGGGGTSAGGGNVPLVAPSITTQPATLSNLLGQTATFSVSASGNPSPTYHWSRNGSPINGAVSASYTTPATTKADNGNTFSVMVTNSQGSITSNTVNLTVQWAPTITTHPGNQTITEGQTATFLVVADANPAPAYQWLKNGQTITGATLASYTTPVTNLSDTSAAFTVVVSNGLGSQTSNPATLTVNPIPVPPSITTQPESATVQVGQNASFSVVGFGTAPLSYQWRKNGTAITTNGTTSSYSITSVQDSDAASYDVIVNNVTNQPITSNAAILTVTPAPQAPSITNQPVDVVVTEGNSASFSVVAGGTAPLSYHWQKNQVDITGATLSTYTVSAAPLADTGAKYRCHVTNTTGDIYSNAATLTVNPAPQAPVITSFTANPTSITLGQSTTLAWAVTGATNLYLLQDGLGNVTGLTSKQVTPATTGNYSYDLAAENVVGTTYANTRLTVNPAPTYSLSVNLGAGITGTPSGSNTYAQGTVVSYSYSLVSGYSNLQVTLDGNPVAASGSVTMDAAHTLAATATTKLPSITGISPTSGPVGTTIVITGSNFVGATSVTVGGQRTTSFTVNGNNQITAPAPGGSGGVIAVTTPFGTATSTESFQVTTPAPTISGFSPTAEIQGAQITITGTNLGGVTTVSFNGVQTTFTPGSNTRITAKVPLNATSGPISLTTPGGTTTSPTNFTVGSPAITRFSPVRGLPGTSVVITGAFLIHATGVTFNGTSASFTVNGENQITAILPTGATTGPLQISVAASGISGSATSAASFTVTNPPVISSFNPASGPIGEFVTIRGTNLTDTTSVAFNGTNAISFIVVDDSTIQAKPWFGTTTGRISVSVPLYTAVSSTDFVVATPPPPTITDVSPTSGKSGTSVHIYGTYLTTATSVNIGYSPAYFSVNADGMIAATVPVGAASGGGIEIITPGGRVMSYLFQVIQ